MQSPFICCMRLVATVCGLPVPCLIHAHWLRCSSRTIILMICAHLIGSLRSDASSYLFQRCPRHSSPALSSCSAISCLHALTPDIHSDRVSALGFSIPALQVALNTLPPEPPPLLCHTTKLVYALSLIPIPLMGGLKGRWGLTVFLP
jgi:hypothetical protein